MRRPLVLILLALVVLVGGACGKDEPSDTSSGADSSEEAASGDKNDGDDEFSGKGSGEFCDEVRALEETDKLFEDDATPEEQREQAREALERLDGLSDEAPDEIADDLDRLLNGLRPLLEAIAEGKDLSTMTPEEQKKFEELSTPEYQAAGERVNSYVEKVCKIDTDDDGDTDGETSTSDSSTTSSTP